MKFTRCRRAIFAALVSPLVLFLVSPPVRAEAVTPADLQAVTNALGFLNNLPRGGPIVVGIVYGSDTADARARAAQVASALESLRGPNDSSFRAVIMSVRDLTTTAGHLDAVFLLPGTLGQAAAIGDAARRRQVITISTDPSCMDAKCCVLMVRSAGRVHIVLDMAMADSVGANFSSVFEMMVERR
jgi:hypothetical protein